MVPCLCLHALICAEECVTMGFHNCLQGSASSFDVLAIFFVFLFWVRVTVRVIQSWKAHKESRLVGVTQRYITKCQHRERGECIQYTQRREDNGTEVWIINTCSLQDKNKNETLACLHWPSQHIQTKLI